MAASYAKPDDAKVTRVPLKLERKALPASGRKGPPPPLPKGRNWLPATRAAWREWWKSPQAVMWDQSGKTLHRWVFLLDCLYAGDDPVRLSAEMRQHEDRHGMSPKALAQLAWFIVDDEQATPATSPTPLADRRQRLRIADAG